MHVKRVVMKWLKQKHLLGLVLADLVVFFLVLYVRRPNPDDRHGGEKRAVMFLKTHKTASCTLQNIFFRYGQTRNLRFASPRNMYNFGYTLTANMIEPLGNGDNHFDILLHHTRFNVLMMETFFPKRRTTYVTIVRDPVRVTKSYFDFYGTSARQICNAKWFQALLMSSKEAIQNKNCTSLIPLRNPMLFDFGLDYKHRNDTAKINSKIKQIIDRFDLVIIAEYFDEGLILLKNLLNLELSDIAYFRQNVMAGAYKTRLSSKLDSKIRQLNQGDQMLYDALLYEFFMKLQKYGFDKIVSEVSTLRRYNQRLYDECVFERVPYYHLSPEYRQANQVYHPYVYVYTLRLEAAYNETCIRLARTEMAYSKFIRELQHQPNRSTLYEH